MGQHKVPNNALVTVTVSVTAGQALTGANFRDYFPDTGWAVSDPGDGTVVLDAPTAPHIEWAAGDLAAGQTVTREYVVLSPELTSPPTTYYFWSEVISAEGTAWSDPWDVIVADPARNREAHYRIGNDDGTQDTHTWKAAADTAATGILKNTNFRVRFQHYNDGSPGYSWRPQIEYATSTSGPWTALPTTSGAPPFFVSDTAQFANGAAVTSFQLGTGTGTWQNGVAYDTVNPVGTAITLNAGGYTEIEFSVQANANAADGTTYYFRLTNAGTAATSYANYAQIAMAAGAAGKEAHYRIGNDDGDANTHTWRAAADTAASGIAKSANFRVRFQVYNDGGAVYSWQPQIESSPDGSAWTALPTTSGAPPFFVSATAQFVNGAAVTSAQLGTGTGTWQNGVAYDTVNPPGSAITLTNGNYTEIEFSVQANNNASDGATYYFRLTNNGTALTSYVNNAQISMAAAAGVGKEAHYRIGNDDGDANTHTWKAAADTAASGIAKSANFRVRFQVYNDGTGAYSWQPQIESSPDGSAWTALPTATGAPPFFVSASANFVDGAAVTSAQLGTGTGTWQNGVAYDTSNPPGSAITLTNGNYTEIEFSVQANANASDGATYYFRLTNNGTVLTSYVNNAQISIAAGATETDYLHAADVVVGSTTYNTMNTGAVAGTLATASVSIGTTGVKTLADGASISIFASNAVPAGYQWDLGGTWTFTTYASASATGGIGYMRAELYRIAADGTASLLATTADDDVNALANTTYTLMTWTYAVSAGTVISEGERFGVRFLINVTTRKTGATAYLGFDITAQNSNVVASKVQSAIGYAKEAHYRIGQDAPLAGMTWYAATDTVATGIPRNTNFRVRFQVYNNGGGNKSWRPQLEYSITSGSGYAAVPTTSGAPPFFVTTTAQFANGDPISAAALGTPGALCSGCAWQNGAAYESDNPPASAVTLNTNSYTEIEFNLQANSNAAYSTTYYFRLTDAGTALSAYANEGQITMQAEPAPPTPTPVAPAHAQNPSGYTATTDACAMCHRAHSGTGKPLQRAGKGLGTGEEATCYVCHDGTGAPANVYAEFQKTYAHPVGSTTDVHATRETRVGSTFSGANRHVECMDCHNPHKAGQSTHAQGDWYASSVLQGQWGITPTFGGAWTTPTYTQKDPVQFEYEVCFKCHSAWAYGASPPTGISGFTETDQSIELNPANRAVHPVAGQGKNQSANWPDTTFVSPWTKTSRVQCVDCHGSDDPGGPKGPHGSANKFLLRGARPPFSGIADEAHVVCLNCHEYNVYYGGAQSGSRVTHPINTGMRSNTKNSLGVWCLSCHGGDLSRGSLHGTNYGVGTQGTAPLGDHFFNGAAIAGLTDNGQAGGGTCWTKAAGDSFSSCTQHSGGTGITFNYDY